MLITRQQSDFCFSHNFENESEKVTAAKIRKAWLYGTHAKFKDVMLINLIMAKV